MWAVVPLKSPETAKSRLADALSGSQRRELFFSMARHVLQTLRASPGITQVAVVTSSNEVAHLAQEYGCRVMIERAALRSGGTVGIHEVHAVFTDEADQGLS